MAGLGLPVKTPYWETKDKENWIGTWGKGILFYDAEFKNPWFTFITRTMDQRS